MKRQNTSTSCFRFNWLRAVVVAALWAALPPTIWRPDASQAIAQMPMPALKHFNSTLKEDTVLTALFDPTRTAQHQIKGQEAQLANDALAEAEQFYRQGIELYQGGEFQVALESFQQAVRLYQEANDREREADALTILGIAYGSSDQYSQAIESFQQALSIRQERGDRQGEAMALSGLGLTFRNSGQYPQAMESYQQVLAISQERGDHDGEAHAFKNLGDVYYYSSQYSQSIAFYQQALTITRETGDRTGEADALSMIGLALFRLGQYSQVVESLQQALSIRREIGDREGEVKTLNTLGVTYGWSDQRLQAIDSYQQALTIAREIGYREGEAMSLHGLGNFHLRRGQYAQAIEFYQRALTQAQEIGDHQNEAGALQSLGNSYLALSQYRQAIETYQQVLTISQGIGDPEGEANAFHGFGDAYVSLGQYSRAIENYQQALTISQEIGNLEGEANTLHGLSNAYLSLDQYSEAIASSQQSLTIAQKIGNLEGEAKTLHGLGNAYVRAGQYSQAIESYQQSLTISQQISSREGEANTLGGLGNAYIALGQYSEAIASYQQSLTIVQETGDRASEAGGLNNIGYAFFKLGQFSDAESFLFDSMKVSESLRAGLSDLNRVSIFDTQRGAYYNLQRVFVAQGRNDEALEIAERGRARAFAELLSQRLLPSQIESQESASSAAVSPPDISQIRQIAKEQNATLVEYSDLGEELLIWVVKPTGEITLRRVDTTAIEQALSAEATTNTAAENRPDAQVATLSDLASRTREAIGVTSDRSAYADPQAKRLLQNSYQMLIEPIADLLPATAEERVIFIPQGSLLLIPFPALQDKNGTYLIEQHTILTAPSIQTLALTQQQQLQRKSPANEILVVGNPTMPLIPTLPGEAPLQISPLPGAEQEALEIAQLFGTQALIGPDATESTVVQHMSDARIVHLATHGLLDYGQPGELSAGDLPGAVVLASSDEDDGLLTASEIIDLDLNADLVVLSACDTGIGRITGDGVIGLSRSLIAAGTPSVIVSLWKVPDDSTAMLMTEFYRQLQQNPDKAQALRQAMLTTMAEHPPVRDWAAFTLIGEAE